MIASRRPEWFTPAAVGLVAGALMLVQGASWAQPQPLPEPLRVMTVRGGEVCFEASPRINWQKTAQRYFTEFPLYRPDAQRVKAAMVPPGGRAVFEYPAALPFPKGWQRYFAVSLDAVQEVNPVRAIGHVTYRAGRDGQEIVGPFLSGLICGPASAKKATLPDDLLFVVATRPDMRIERIDSSLAPFGKDAIEISSAAGRWRFYAEDLGGRGIAEGRVLRAQPGGPAFLVARMDADPPDASTRCRQTFRIYELAAQPVMRLQQAYGCS
ncbi:MAG: hypothetical protein MUF79_02830 [Burkholderiales bacterium]|jgi:hypothetical protein|nr:hypothetical protein [Burkholderiales bacterium]